MRFAFLLFLLLVMPLTSQEQIDVQVTISSNEITVDETLVLHAILRFEENLAINRNQILGNLLRYTGVGDPPFRLQEEKIIREELGLLEIEYLLEPQILGKHPVSLFNIEFDSGEEKGSVLTDIFEVDVILPKEAKSLPLLPSFLLEPTEKLPVEISYPNRVKRLISSDQYVDLLAGRSIPWEQIVVFFLFIAIVQWGRSQKPVTKLTPEQIQQRQARVKSQAMIALRALAGTQQYAGLTNMVRGYLEKQYDIQATTETTIESLHSISKNRQIHPEVQQKIEHLLEQSDRVKFARYQPSQEEWESAYKTARDLISDDSNK